MKYLLPTIFLITGLGLGACTVPAGSSGAQGNTGNRGMQGDIGHQSDQGLPSGDLGAPVKHD